MHTPGCGRGKGMALALMALDPSLDQRSGCFYSATWQELSPTSGARPWLAELEAIPPGKHLFVED